jgi:uncharacterized protein
MTMRPGRFSIQAGSARELVGYFALAYGITWGGILLYLATLRFDLAGIGIAEAMLMFGLMLLGPFAAGLILASRDGPQGLIELLRGFTRVRVPLRWYAFTLLTAPLLLVAVLLPLAAWVSPDYAPGFVIFGIIAGLIAGSIEEVGWTGYATPRLLAHLSPLRAGLVLGLAWSAWHALADFAGTIGALTIEEWLVRMLIVWIAPLTGYRVLMTWAYARHRSAALNVIAHASYTGVLATLTMEMPAASGPQTLLWHVLFAAAVWLVVVVVALSSRRDPRGRPTPSRSAVRSARRSG